MLIGKSIRSIRKRKGLKQKDLALMIGISEISLSKIETDKVNPHKNTLKKICDKLEIPVSFLYFISLTDEDIKQDKKILFNALKKNFEDLILD